MYWKEVKIVTTPIVVIIQPGKTLIASNDFWTFFGSFPLDPNKTIDPQENIQINPIISYMVRSRLFIHITLELSGCASRSPLEWLVMRALAFDTEPLFWPFWHWTSRASLPDLHTANYRFLKPTKISFCKIKNPPGSTTTQKKQTKWSCLHLLPASKKRLLKLPPQRTTHKTEFSRI